MSRRGSLGMLSEPVKEGGGGVSEVGKEVGGRGEKKPGQSGHHVSYFWKFPVDP